MKTIKIITTLTFIAALLVGCENQQEEKGVSNNGLDSSHQQIEIIKLGASSLQEYKYDGCQYIGRLYNFQTDVLTHKGNCNNPIHTNNQFK